jgi:hypothetical protein
VLLSPSRSQGAVAIRCRMERTDGFRVLTIQIELMALRCGEYMKTTVDSGGYIRLKCSCANDLAQSGEEAVNKNNVRAQGMTV